MSAGTHKPAEALNQLSEPQAEALRLAEICESKSIFPVADELLRLHARITELEDDLQFVERWAVHHGSKPSISAEEALSCIQHYPAIHEITKSYKDGKRPDTFNPYARIAELESQLAAAPVQAAVPLPLLLHDIARDIGITVPQACIALKPLGNYSTNSAVTAEMARMLRDHFPAPAHPAEGAADEDDAFEKWWSTPHVWSLAHKAAQRSAFAAGVAHAAATQPAAQGMELDAARYQWLRDGNAYAPEEAAIQGGEFLDELCDDGIAFAVQAKQGEQA